MLTLKNAVEKYFPNEQIINELKVNLTDTWSNPMSKSKYWYLTAMDFIETDKKYYFDRRQAYLHNYRKYFIPSILWTFVPVLLLWLYVWDRTPESFILVIIIPVMATLIQILNIRDNENGLANILVLDKSWITNSTNQNNEYILEGELSTADSYSFPFFLSIEQQNNLSFTEKFYSGIYFNRLFKIKKKGPHGTKFTFKYKPA